MKPWQILVLMVMASLALALFCVTAFLSRSLFIGTDSGLTISQVAEATTVATKRPTATPTQTPSPTVTLSPTPTETLIPTPTPTRVVVDTATPTASNTPTNTPVVPTNTPTSTPRPSGGSSYYNPPAPVATPGPQYPFSITAGPVSYETSNHFLVILVSVTSGSASAPGYRLVGTHNPTGFQWESDLSCPDLCKASGPEAVYDDEGEEEITFKIREGNLVFEAPVYETGTWNLVLVDSHGQQVSDVIQLTLDAEDKHWFYYVLGK